MKVVASFDFKDWTGLKIRLNKIKNGQNHQKKTVSVLYTHLEEIFRLLKNKRFQFLFKQNSNSF